MSSYPISFDIQRPERFERPHVLLRILIAIALSVLLAIGWLLLLIYLAVPVVAAAMISRKEPENFLQEDAPKLARWLTWFAMADAYFTLLTDRFSPQRPEDIVRVEVRPNGSPDAGSALLWLVYSFPSAVVLAALMFVAAVTWIVAAIMILVQEDYPDSLYRYHRGVVRWAVRLLGYHASLTDEYPPFELDRGPAAAPSSGSTLA